MELRVLVVDSDVSFRYSLCSRISSCGFICVLCRSASEALESLRLKKPDIVLIGGELAEMSGIKLLRVVKKEMSDLPIIMMIDSSCYPEEPILDCQGYIFKPLFDHESLREKLLQAVHASNVGCNDHPRGEEDAQESSNSSADHSKEVVVFSPGFLGNPMKKGRLVWTEELNEEFVAVVNALGPKEHTPSKILEAMHKIKYTYLTREHIASHLQKYKGKKRTQEDVNDISANSSVDNGGNPAKKPRVVWTKDLKNFFEDCVKKIGHDNVTPKKILKAMEAFGFIGLTRENISSHLQKYKNTVKGASKSTEYVPNKGICSVGDEKNQAKMAQCSSSGDHKTSFEDDMNMTVGSPAGPFTCSTSYNNQIIVPYAHCNFATTEKAQGSQIIGSLNKDFSCITEAPSNCEGNEAISSVREKPIDYDSLMSSSYTLNQSGISYMDLLLMEHLPYYLDQYGPFDE